MRRNLMLFLKSRRSLHIMAYVLVFHVFLAISEQSFAQDKVQITGNVTEGLSGDPLPGVSIIIKGTSAGTITDIDGNYSLEALSTDLLVFSFIGYLDEEILVGNNTKLDVDLALDVIGLEEVVVTGYGVQKKSDITGSIASVSGEDLNTVAGGTFDEALKGRAAGVFSSTESGAPGSNAVIRIRGVSSINGGDPLFIVDGVPMSIYSISALNPADIQSVEVLKDASSQSIYGASAGNGVVIITTKQGEKGEVKTELNYYYGHQMPIRKVDMLGTKEFFEVYNSMGLPESTHLGWSEDTIATLPDINWQDELMRNAPMHNVDFAVSGGTEKSTYRFSMAYFLQDGVIPNSNYRRINARLNSQHQITKRIKLGENLTLSNERVDGFPDYYYNDTWVSPVGGALQMHPFVEPYNDDPALGGWNNWNVSPVSNVRNPFVYIDVTNREIPTYRLDGDVNLSIDIIKGMKYRTIIGGNIEFGYTKDFSPEFYYNAQVNNNLTTIEKEVWRNQGWSWQHTLTYDFNFGENNFSLMGGIETNYYKNEGIIGTRYDLLNESETMHYFNAALDADNIGLVDRPGLQEVSSSANFGRITYNYKGKYLLTSNIRYDISSRFGLENRKGLFPSINGGWKFSEEEFMRSFSRLSFGKIRAGWGQIGNSGLEPYRYFARMVGTNVYNYPIDGVNLSSGIAPHGIGNSMLHWEAMNSFNYGIDLTFFSNRLSFSGDYFVKRNTGMIIERPTPDFMGTYQESPDNEGGSTRLVDNLGGVKNTGFEITAGYKSTEGEFKHDINANFSYVTNEVLDTDGDTIIDGNAYFYNNLTFTAEGFPMGQFYGYETDGIFQEADGYYDEAAERWFITNQPYVEDDEGNPVYAQRWAEPGDLRFVDKNDDGVINSDDRTQIGNPHPKCLLGLSYNLSWNNFDFSMFWQGALGFDIMRISKGWLYNQTGTSNWGAEVKDRWTPDNPTNDYPRVVYGDLNRNISNMSDFFVEKGNYLRLKNIQLGYTLPENIVSKINIGSLRIYVSAKDLLTITKYGGTDPEVAINRNPLTSNIDISAYPRPLVISMGLNASF